MDHIQNYKIMPTKPSPETIEFLTKWGAFLTWILIGLLGKFGLDLVSGRKFSRRYALGSGCLAVCAGWLSYQWCVSHPSLSPGVVVSISALASRDIILFITMVDWPGMMKILTNKNTKKRNEE